MILPSVMPLWYQVPSWMAHFGGKKFKITSYPRRHGKDIEDLSIAAMEAVQSRGSYYYVFPTRKWAKRAIWDTVADINGISRPIIDHVFPPEIVLRKNESDLFIELKNGSMFFMGGTDNLDFVGQGGQGYTMSEFSLHKREVTSLLTPIIRQSQAYLHLNGTMRGKRNPLYEILDNTLGDPQWFSTWLTPEQTKLYCWVSDEYDINPELLKFIGKEDPLTGRLYCNSQGVPFWNIQDDINSGLISHAFARQEFLNRAETEVAGGYYGHELKALRDRGGIRAINPHNDVVYTFWDLGGVKEESDTTAILFAHINGNTAHVVDYYENRGELRGHYFDVLDQKGYNYGGHFFPHDAKRSNVWNGETAADTAMRVHGIEVRFIPKTQNVLNDIEITRRGFATTSFSDLADPLLQHLGNYHERESTGKPCHQNNCSECHGASHGADTFRYMWMAIHLGLVTPYLDPNERRERLPEFIEDDWMLV